MNQHKLHISQTIRFKIFIFLLSIISGANLFSAHAKFDHIYLNNNIVERNNIDSIKDNDSFLYNDKIVKPEKDNHTINLSLFEIEEEDNFSYSRKGFKSYQQTTSICFHRFIEHNNINQNFTSFSHPHSFSKSPLYISYQVYRI